VLLIRTEIVLNVFLKKS